MTVTQKIVATLALCMFSAVSAAEGKIAILNPSGAILASAAAKAKFEKLEKSADYAATKAKLDGVVADIKSLQAAYQKENATWTDEKKAESEKKLQNLNQDYQFNAKKLQTSQQELGQQIMQELGPKAEAAVKQIIEAEKIGLVLNSQAAIHASAEYDITPKVTELLNKAK
ncbi:MAG TPA: OmpH family outer membrane protein [Cellvibrio sp.]|nr:OmpH family outer membrane protein [Cellvibrio sp.]